MALSKYCLGDLLDRNKETNENLEFGIANVRGVLNTKGISNTKVSVDDRDLSKFLVVRPGGFIFNHRVHDKLGLGYNTSDEVYIFTNDYVAFYVKPEIAGRVLLPEYLYIWYLRSEFDRYMLFKTYGSATLFFNWDNMCELEIELPEISVQQKYVDIYKAMVANQQSYERGLEDLRLVCDGYIEDLRRRMPCERIEPYIEKVDERNVDKRLGILDVKSVNMDGTFAKTVANVDLDRIHTYKIVKPKDFAYTNRINIGSIAYRLPEDCDCLVSASYDVFRIINQTKLVPEYLTLWIRRKEFFRSTGFYSVGSVKDSFTVDMMKGVKIPIPEASVQTAIVEVYSTYLKRKKINEQLKAQIKDICPILIKGSLEEGERST